MYFATQNPTDIPDRILGQLGNRVQHALRAFSPADQKAVKAAAETFRANPKLDTVKVITEIGVGEALVSVLDAKGTPSVVERAFILPPRSRLTPLSPEERAHVVRDSVLQGHYETALDRESAYEKLKEKAAQRQAEETAGGAAPGGAPKGGRAPEARSGAGVLTGAMVKSAAHAIGSRLGRQIIRGSPPRRTRRPPSRRDRG